MPPFNNFTTKAKEVIRKAHELAIERGQNHVNSLHLLIALLVQEDSLVISILDKMEVDTMLLTDNLIEMTESPENRNTLSPSYQIYLTPDLAQIIENSAKVAVALKDEFVSTEHLFVSLLDGSWSIRSNRYNFTGSLGLYFFSSCSTDIIGIALKFLSQEYLSIQWAASRLILSRFSFSHPLCLSILFLY
ncbi:MAG: ATP-dependent chaperone ClpB [Candidatus Woesebacteria bacterium GW2011_GWC1_42_9]|nr:MAG: ATP-dependent chaperone ClpB [Candidatus Woesebacteria bacterium GW2011_GWC1_42_9]